MTALSRTFKFLAVPLFLFLCSPAAEASYRVQQGTTTLTSTSQQQAISAVSGTDRAFVIVHYYYASDGTGNVQYNADVGMVSAYLEDTANIRFSRGSASDDVTVSWTVIEALDQEFEVFRGNQAWSGTTTLYTPSIGSTVTGQNCFAWINGTTSNSAAVNRIREHYFTADVSSGSQTTLNVRRYAPDGGPSGTLRWIVVEFDTGKIGGLDSGEETVTTQVQSSPLTFSISGCEKDRSLLVAQWRVSGDDGLNAHAIAFNLQSDTQGYAYVHTTANWNRVMRWYTIDFGSRAGSRQEGTVDNSSDSGWATADRTLSPGIPVDRGWSMVGITSNGDGTAFPRPCARHWLSDSTTLEIEHMRTGQPSWIEWQVLELPYTTPTPTPVGFHTPVATATPTVIPTPTPGPTTVYLYDLSTDPGWTTEGDWAYGQPTGGGGEYGNPDPTTGYSGNNVYGYNLAGDYPNNLTPTRWLTTSAMDCSQITGTTLNFYRWLNVERNSYDHAYLEISSDGLVWSELWANPDSATEDSSWSEFTYDISSVADRQPAVYLRWGMGITDGSWRYSSWNIDDIRIRGFWQTTPTPSVTPSVTPTATPTPVGLSLIHI